MNIFVRSLGVGIHRILLKLQPNYECTLESLVGLIEIPPQQEMGDYAFPCFTLAKVFRNVIKQLWLVCLPRPIGSQCPLV